MTTSEDAVRLGFPGSVAVTMAVLSIGCGGTSDRTTTAAKPASTETAQRATADGAPEKPNWLAGAGIVDPVPVASVSEAGLAFSPNVPESALGSPTRILASDPATTAPVDREVAWVFDDPVLGLFVIQQRVVPRAALEAEWHALVAEEPGCEKREDPAGGTVTECHRGQPSFVPIRNGLRAFLVKGDVVTAVHWAERLKGADESALAEMRARFENPNLELVLEIVVIGPELTAAQAVAVANLV